MQKLDHKIGFWEKRQFFCLKLAKIAENCDHNIDPRCVSEKVAQTVVQSIFCENQCITFTDEKSSPIIGAIFSHKLPKVDSHPVGENSPNLVTLLNAVTTFQKFRLDPTLRKRFFLQFCSWKVIIHLNFFQLAIQNQGPVHAIGPGAIFKNYLCMWVGFQLYPGGILSHNP
jgi:hypothetical protein